MKKKRNSTFVNNLITYLIVIVAFVAVTLLQNAGMISRSLKGQLVPICVYIVMAVSLNLVVGISGELSLGHAGFMSVGAFAGAIFCMATQDGIADAYGAADSGNAGRRRVRRDHGRDRRRARAAAAGRLSGHRDAGIR